MLTYLKGSVIQSLRHRTGLSQIALAEIVNKVPAHISRFELGVRSPKEQSLGGIMTAINLPVETFFCPVLNTSVINAYSIRDKIIYNLHWGEFYPEKLTIADNLITELNKSLNAKDAINLQLIYRCLSRLYELRGSSAIEIVDMTKEAIALTYPTFNPNRFVGGNLLFNELELVQLQARAYHRQGDTNKGIALLTRARIGLVDSCQDLRSKETVLASVLLDLARAFLDIKEYENAIEVCNQGIAVSNRRNRGKYTPDFVFIKAKALQDEALFKSAFASFALMRNYPMAKTTLGEANKRGINFETYDMEKQELRTPAFEIEHATIPKCKTVGDFFANMRITANLSLDEASYGICSKSMVSDLENKNKYTSVFNMEALLQRYGVSIDKYFAVFLSKKDFETLQLRDEANIRLAQKLYDEHTDNCISKLANTNAFKRGLGLQYVKSAAAEIYGAKNGRDNIQLEMLKEALLCTQKTYDEDSIARQRFMYSEVVILNQIGINLCESKGKHRSGLKIFEALVTNLKNNYVDEVERMRMLPSVLSNHALCRGRAGDRQYAYELAIEGDELCVKHFDFQLASSFATTRAYNILELGDPHKKSFPIFIQVYYAGSLLGKAGVMARIKAHVQERFNVEIK